MDTEPLKLIPLERWGELKSVAQSDLPRSLPLLRLLETEEYLVKIGIDYGFKIYCPNGEVNHGVVAFNIKKNVYEIIVICPRDDTSELEKALQKTELIDWSRIIEMPYAHKNVVDCITRIAKEKSLKLSNYKKMLTYLLKTDSSLFDVRLKPAFTFRLLSEDHIDITNNTWSYKYPGSEWYYALLIKGKLGYGLFKNNELVAWSFIKEMGSLGHMYTMENNRRKGYGELVLKLISNVLLKEKKYVYAHCMAGNNIARNLYEKLGFVNVVNVDWLILAPY